MNSIPCWRGVVLGVGLAIATQAADTTLLTFDDLSPGPNHIPVPVGYGGLDWENFGVLNGLARPTNEGYHTGTVSPSNVVYNAFGDPASIRRGANHRFDLKSAYLTAAAAGVGGDQVRVEGFVGSTVLYENTYAINTTAPSLVHLNYDGVDEVKFTSLQSRQVAMDNVTVAFGPPLPVVSIATTVPETAEPSPNTRVQPGEFTIFRSGDTNEPLILYIEIAGSAIMGPDFEWIEQFMTMPAGERTVKFFVTPLDDLLGEGDETVVVRLREPPINSLPNYAIDPVQDRATVVIHDNDPLDPVPAVVLEMVEPEAAETHPFQGAIFWAEFRVRRTSLFSNELVVYFGQPWGMATFGTDYFLDGVESGPIVRLAPGQASKNVRLYPIDDDVYEGAESAIIDLIPPPPDAPQRYLVHPAAASVFLTIHDNDPPPPLPVVSLNFVWPGRTAEPCPTCLVAAAAFRVSRTGSTNWELRVYLEYDGTATPGVDYHELPREVTIPAGARSTDFLVYARDDLLVEGPEIVRAKFLRSPFLIGYTISEFEDEALVVIFDDEPGAPEIRLDIIEPQAGAQLAIGSTISISALGVWTRGEIDQPVRCFAGDTFIGQSYPPAFGRPTIPGLPSIHTIFWTNPPSGQHTLRARFERVPNVVTESPPVTITVGDTPRAVLSIAATSKIAEESSYPLRRLPRRGEFTITRTGPTNSPISVYMHYSGTATSGGDYPTLPSLVTIAAGDAATTIEVVPFDDGRPEGLETVIAAISDCASPYPCGAAFEIDAARQRATVYIADNALTPLFDLAITKPAPGAEFPPDASVEIVAETRHLDGYVRQVEFFADGRKIGEVGMEFLRPPDGPVTQMFPFLWRDPVPGRHTLTVRATDNRSLISTSAPVEIRVLGSEPLPMVTVSAPDSFAVEPGSNAVANTATFRIRRYGPTADPLTVVYSLHGTAASGTDYETLPGLATIAAGQRSVEILVRPLPDNLHEGMETVRLRVEDSPAYRVGRRRAAAAVIADHPWLASPGAARCIALPGNLRHLCFAAETGHNFRIEATSDWRTWETLYDTFSADGAWHFIDVDAENYPQRFYRLTPEPVPDIEQ